VSVRHPIPDSFLKNASSDSPNLLFRKDQKLYTITYKKCFPHRAKHNTMQDLSQHAGVLKKHGYRQDEAIILLMRLQLLKIIQAEISRRKWSQQQAASILEVAQPRISEIAAMATDKFSTEMLIKFLHRLGLRASLTVKPGKHYVAPRRIRKKESVRNAASKAAKPTKLSEAAKVATTTKATRAVDPS
jgi:predicted XRE-type DNA-binding protein